MSDPLEHVLFNFSEKDRWRTVDAVEGTFITGSPGSGKTSTFAKQLAHRFLKAGYGGLVLTAKAEETRNWIGDGKTPGYIQECGREKDLILFNAESQHAFDLLFYEWNRPGRGAADLEAVIDMFSTLLSIGKPHSGSNSADRFWELAVEGLMRNVIVVLSLSGEAISIETIDAMIRSLPRSLKQADDPEWQSNSYCGLVFSAIREGQKAEDGSRLPPRNESFTEGQKGDFNLAERFPDP